MTSRWLTAAVFLTGVALLAPTGAAAQDCSNPAAACADMLSDSCAERYGAGAIALEDTPSADECATDMAQYRGCLQTVLRLCGGAPSAEDSPAPTTAPAAPVQSAYDPAGRSYRVGVVTLSNLSFSPKPGSQVLQNEQVNVTFTHDVCCNAETRIWVRAKTKGSCSMAGAGSPLFKGRGEGDGYVVSRSGPCEITGIVFRVKQEDKDQTDEFTVPATYMIE